MLSKGFGIAALVFAVLAFLAMQVSIVLHILSPVLFGLSFVLASLSALKGDRGFTIAALAVCLTGLVLFSTGSIVTFHREEDAAWRFAVIVGFLAPVAGLFFATARARSVLKAYVLPSFVLLFVLAGFQMTDLLKVGSDWGWQRGGREPKSVQLPDDACFSTPDVFCVLDLAKKQGLPVRERMYILKRIAELHLEAGNAVAAIELLIVASSTYESSLEGMLDTRLLQQIAMLQWKAGDSSAAKETLNRAREVAKYFPGIAGVEAMLCVELSQIEIDDPLGARATRAAALRKVRNPNYSTRLIVAGLRNIASASAAAGDKAGSREVLAEALAVALEIEDSKMRRVAVHDVAMGYLEIGDLEKASSLAQEIEHQATRRKITDTIARVRNYPGAVRHLNRLRCEWRHRSTVSSCKGRKEVHERTHYGRARSLAIDAVGQIDAGKLSEATETVKQALRHARRLSNGPLLDPDYRRDRTLALIAPMQAAVGLDEFAFETVWNIDHVVARNAALRDVAIVRVHSGNMQGALLNVWRIADQPLATRPTARAKALGDIALAIGSHSAIARHQTLNWCAVRAVYGIKCGISCTSEDNWSAYF